MKNFRKNLILTLLFGILLFFILHDSPMAKQFAYLGLSVWFEQIIPSLFPFMIISSMLVQLNLDEILIQPCKKIIGFLYRISDAGIYVLIMGFLCGFPMGAKTAALEYQEGKITKNEAEYLLAFTNNIGPVYFLSFVYGQIYQGVPLWIALFFLYVIPLLYGLILRYTSYRHLDNEIHVHLAAETVQNQSSKKSFLNCLDESIQNGLIQIAMLGGYMVICNLLVMFPKLLFDTNPIMYALSHALTEISGGLMAIRESGLSQETKFVYAHFALSFTGISCHLQTFHILGHAGLSKQKYMLHKLVLCSIVGITLSLYSLIL